MKPALILITGTGPAPHEVADLLRPRNVGRTRTLVECPCGCGTGVVPGEHCALLGWEVREFEAVPRRLVALGVVPHKYDGRVGAMAKAICREDGGTEWLTDRMLPARYGGPDAGVPCRHPGWGLCHYEVEVKRNGYMVETRYEVGPDPDWPHPPKLAILAPDAPPLLRERVLAWGGTTWKCGEYGALPDRCCSIGKACYTSYREAVLDALGVRRV